MSWQTGLEHIVRQAEPLAPLTWFRLGGAAQWYAEPTSVDELALLLRRAHEAGLPVRCLGGGSNVLVRDSGVSGLVVHLTHPDFSQIAVRDGQLVAGGGARLGHVISTAVREGLAGLEPLVGIPGTVGGALRSNAGTRGHDIGQLVEELTLLLPRGEIVTRRRSELTFAYRTSNLEDALVLQARFALDHDSPLELTQRMQKNWIVKKASQPLAHQATGCIFKHSQGQSAGELIDRAGLKGTRVGAAEVCDRHANYIVADAGATVQDVLRLIDLVRTQVAQRLGVELELQIEIW